MTSRRLNFAGFLAKHFITSKLTLVFIIAVALMGVVAVLQTPREENPQIIVPAAAVVREDNNEFVFVQIAPSQYRLTPVVLGAETGGVRPVQSGLKEGEVVVVEGAFHLNNERKRKELEGS